MTTAPLPCRSVVSLHVQDGLLAGEDEELPFARNVAGAIEHFYLIENFVFVVLVGAQAFERLGGFPQGESGVDVESEAQGHDMCVVLTELEGRG